jgi:hypothetical protein
MIGLDWFDEGCQRDLLMRVAGEWPRQVYVGGLLAEEKDKLAKNCEYLIGKGYLSQGNDRGWCSITVRGIDFLRDMLDEEYGITGLAAGGPKGVKQ